ncbi:DUF721 domain-containing protein [Portibacter marinus]|uniref:DUF721 domain-containing protein n=1 Tax=Portibacter marinus TaxID=2898660 RepID=UPI001F3D93CB|nr:DUF721 domain-containing protein [Portibacter marinus]
MTVKKNDLPIKEVLDKYIKQSKINPGFYNAKIQKIWKEKMGNSVNQHTLSIKLYGKELYIKLDSAPLKNEFHLSKDKLRKLLNEEIGSDVVEKIHIT